MCHHDQTLSIIDQVGFIFTLYNTPTTDSSPYGRASKLLRLDEHKDVLLLKAYQALTRLVNYEGETNQKKRDSHDRAYGIVSGYQVALLEDIKTILKTNDDIRDNYIKSLTIMATDSKEPEPMAADVFAFICSVLRKDRPEPWSPVKRTLFSTSSSTKKSNSNNTAPNLLRRRINPESYSLLFNKQWETIALKQDSDRTFAIEQLEKNIRRYYLFDEYYTYVRTSYNPSLTVTLNDFDQRLSLLTILVEYPYATHPTREEVIRFVCEAYNDSGLNDEKKVLINTRIQSAIVEIYGKNIPREVLDSVQSLTAAVGSSQTDVERPTEQINASFEEQRERLLPVSTFFLSCPAADIFFEGIGRSYR